MDSNPSFSLSFLYQSDPIYSLYASDLMTASKTVNNHFIKEQKQLLKTLRRLEQQQLIRRRQLSEEQRTFAFIMTKRLGQRGARPHTDPSYSTTTSAFSALPLRMPQSAPAALATHTTGSDTFGSAKGANSRETKFKVETSSNLQLED